MNCQDLLRDRRDLWHQATVHPFLEQCHLGTIKPEQFNTWLVQDYLFVIEFTRFFARVFAAAPPEHFDVLLGGLAALKEELNWFKVKAGERQLALDSPKQATCNSYCKYMEEVAGMSYPVLATTLWAIELAYNQAWQLPGPMAKPYDEFAQRWGNPGFTEYVKLLEKQADEALEVASETIGRQAEEAFVQIARLEKYFWQMAFNAGE